MILDVEFDKKKKKNGMVIISFKTRNPCHANYILNVYNMSYVYLNKILCKPTGNSHFNVFSLFSVDWK